jgi:hypothetical protein
MSANKKVRSSSDRLAWAPIDRERGNIAKSASVFLRHTPVSFLFTLRSELCVLRHRALRLETASFVQDDDLSVGPSWLRTLSS